MGNCYNKQRCTCEKCEPKKQPEKVENNCKGCICDQLRKLPTQTEVDVFLSGGQVLEDVVFITINQKNCCAFFNDPTTEPGSTLIVDCQQIQAIRIEAAE
jgi:hypothetical protein